MSNKTITIEFANDTTLVCMCGGTLDYQDEWDKLFDKYFLTIPTAEIIINKLYLEGKPKYVCDTCDTKVLIVCK